MKKVICFIAFVLVYFCSVAQTFPQNPTNGQVQINNTNLGGGTFNRGVRGGVFVDTSAANDVLYMKGTKFMLISTTSDNNYWYRSADTMRWELIATTTSNCAGTQLISGSITWSGSGLVYDATDLDYYILCSRYFANSTTLTLSVADPTNPRIDKFYADNTGNIGVITGTPSANPQEPAINPLTQIDMGFVYIPAGSTVPAGTTQTVIYNENVEWSGTSNVPSVNFTYGTNPYIGSVSTYLPSAPNSSYVEWQSGGIDYLFSDAQYLKFWVRLNANFVSDPLSFLDVTFEYTDVTVSQTLSVGDGDYNMDYSLINQWQLVSIPLTGITTFGTEFNSVHFVINSAPTSFQLDYVYLLETATIPPVISSGWSLNLNLNTNPATNGLGTRDSVALAFKTNSQTRAIMPANGLQLVDDTTYRVMVWNETTKEWAVTYQPTILADSPVIIYQNGYQDRIKLDTTRRGGALATQYYADSVANAGGGGATPGLNAVTLVDSTSEQGIKIATDTAVALGRATLFADSWGAAYGLPNQDLGWFTLVCNWFGWEINNTSLSSSTLMDRVVVDPFGATNMVDRIPLIPYYNTGSDVIGSKLIFAYGLNDVRWNGANYTTANFITDYTTVLDSAIARGWTSDNIVLISTGYLPPTSYVSYGGNPAATQARQLSFDSCINVLATTYGTKYYDAYTFMANNGARALMQSDSIHPNTYGNKVYALGFINNYNEPVRFGSQKLAVNGQSEFNQVKVTNFVTTHSKKAAELVLDSAGNLAASTLRHVYYNGYGNVEIGDNADSIPYRLSVDGSGLINDGLNIYNKNATNYRKWLRLYSDFATGSSLIDAFTPSGGNANLSLQSVSKGKLFFSHVGLSQTNPGGSYADTAGMHFGHTVIKGFNSPFFEGLNLMYISPNGSFITANSAPSTYNNLALQAFGGTVSIGMYPATAALQIKAGTAAASTAPLKFNAGTNLTTPEAGAVEFDGTDLYYTTSTPTRRTIVNTAASQTLSNKTFVAPVLGTPASGDFSSGTFTWPTFNQNTTGSAASLTTSRKINGISFNGTADIAVDKMILAYQALGSSIVAENVDGQLAQVINSLAMTSQRAYFNAVYIDKDQTITGVKWKQVTAGSYTANNYNGVGLYSYSGGTLTLVASSTNDGNIWTATSGTIGSKAFSSPYSATAGLYFVAIIWSASATTTAPSLGTLTASSSINTVTDFTNSAKTSGLISSLTALPSPTQAISGITASANEFWIGLY